jgi:hypothetical protein
MLLVLRMPGGDIVDLWGIVATINLHTGLLGGSQDCSMSTCHLLT